MEIELNLIVTLSDNLKVTGVRINKPSDSFEEAASKTIAVVTPKRSKSKKDQDTIVLEDNKLVLTQKLLDIINAEPGDRLLVSFKEENGIYFPVIAKSEVFADPESGNKLTKSLTVSCRGNANDILSKYGDTFTVTPWKGHEGLFVLIGNKDRVEEPIQKDENINIKEDENSEEDLPLDTKLDNDEAYEIDDISFEI